MLNARLTVTTSCTKSFITDPDHADFLQKICEKTGKFELPVTEQILASPGSGAESWFES